MQRAGFSAVALGQRSQGVGVDGVVARGWGQGVVLAVTRGGCCAERPQHVARRTGLVRQLSCRPCSRCSAQGGRSGTQGRAWWSLNWPSGLSCFGCDGAGEGARASGVAYWCTAGRCGGLLEALMPGHMQSGGSRVRSWSLGMYATSGGSLAHAHARKATGCVPLVMGAWRHGQQGAVRHNATCDGKAVTFRQRN